MICLEESEACTVEAGGTAPEDCSGLGDEWSCIAGYFEPAPGFTAYGGLSVGYHFGAH